MTQAQAERANRSRLALVRRVVMLMASVLLAFVTVAVVRADVTLLYFQAAPGDGQIVLEWETATEYETAGYYVRRNTAPSFSENTRESPYIPAEGVDGQGAFYSFTDTTVTSGTLYYYQLEEVMTNNASNLIEVISATLELDMATPTSTPAPTGMPQPTLTRTASPTPSSTRRPTPLSPGMATFSATPLASRQVTAGPTATSPVVVPASVVATVQATRAPGEQPVATGTAPPTALPSISPSRVPTPTDKPGSTPAARLAPKRSSDAITVIPGGTNWFVMGVAMGMFAVAILLVAGAIYLLRWLL